MAYKTSIYLSIGLLFALAGHAAPQGKSLDAKLRSDRNFGKLFEEMKDGKISSDDRKEAGEDKASVNRAWAQKTTKEVQSSIVSFCSSGGANTAACGELKKGDIEKIADGGGSFGSVTKNALGKFLLRDSATRERFLQQLRDDQVLKDFQWGVDEAGEKQLVKGIHYTADAEIAAPKEAAPVAAAPAAPATAPAAPAPTAPAAPTAVAAAVPSADQDACCSPDPATKGSIIPTRDFQAILHAAQKGIPPPGQDAASGAYGGAIGGESAPSEQSFFVATRNGKRFLEFTRADFKEFSGLSAEEQRAVKTKVPVKMERYSYVASPQLRCKGQGNALLLVSKGYLDNTSKVQNVPVECNSKSRDGEYYLIDLP